MISIKRYFYFLIYMMLIMTFLPVVNINLPPVIGSFHFYALLWVLSLLLFKPALFGKKAILQVMIIGVLFTVIFPLTIWRQLDEWNMKAILYEFYYIFISLTIYWYFITTKDYYGFARIIKVTLIFIIVTALLSIYSSIMDPLYARNMIGGVFSENELEHFKELGGGGYGFATALVALFPVIVYYYRNNHLIKYSKLFILSFGILCFFTLLRMQIFANILFSVVFTVISLLGSKRIRRSVILISLLVVIGLIVPVSWYSKILVSVSDYFDPNSEVYYKLNDMSTFLITGDMEKTGAGYRAARYPELLNAFVHSPILGTSYSHNNLYIGAGAHLFWMNRLTIWGLFGLLIYLQIHIFNLRFNIRKFSNNKEALFFYMLSMGTIIVLGLMKNLSGRETWFIYFLIIPGLFYLPLLNKNKVNMKHDKSDLLK